jgi:thymidylate synthase ThyX
MADKHYAADPARMTTQDAKNHQASTTLPVADAEEAAALLNMAHEVTYSIYETLLGMGVNRETARRALTFDLYSEMYAKVDLHNLLGFLALRTDSHAQQEIREYANAMLELVQPVVPWAIEAWEKNRDTWREYESWRVHNEMVVARDEQSPERDIAPDTETVVMLLSQLLRGAQEAGGARSSSSDGKGEDRPIQRKQTRVGNVRTGQSAKRNRKSNQTS